MNKKQVIQWLKEREFNAVQVWDELLTWKDILEALDRWIFHYSFIDKIIIARSK